MLLSILRWVKRGTRPSAPSTYIFGAVCSREGKRAALIMPACNTECETLHLAANRNPQLNPVENVWQFMRDN
jgi:hypothetical protein